MRRGQLAVSVLTVTETAPSVFNRLKGILGASKNYASDVNKGCSRNYPRGWVGRRHFFVLWGEGVLLTMCLRVGWGGGVTCPGGQGVFDP